MAHVWKPIRRFKQKEHHKFNWGQSGIHNEYDQPELQSKILSQKQNNKTWNLSNKFEHSAELAIILIEVEKPVPTETPLT